MTVTISAITYADVQIAGKTYPDQGMLKSFREEITYAKGGSIVLTVTVNLSRWTGMCSSLEYTVDVAGTTQTSPGFDTFDASKLPRTVAFSPEGGSGIAVGGGPLQADLVTEFAYDEKNRRYIRRQTFGAGDLAYQVAYSAYTYKGPPTGKMASFSAHVSVLPR